MVSSRVPIELPADPTTALQAATKQYIDTGLIVKAGVPFFGAVPGGSATPTILHSLGTLDVDVAVYRVSDGAQVGVPSVRVDVNNVQLTFGTAPGAGQYRIVVSAGTGAGSGGGGGGGLPEAHAGTHAEAGVDPVTPLSIGAAALVHSHSGLTPNGGTEGQILTKNSGSHYDYSWQEGGGGGPGGVKPYPPVTLADVSPIATDASLGTHFRCTLAGDRVLGRPTNAVSGQVILWELTASGASRLLTPHADFLFGVDVVAFSAITNNKTDYVQAVYDERAGAGVGKFRVISYLKGYD